MSARTLAVCRGCTLPHGIEPLRIFLYVLGDELVDRGGETDHLGRNVVDQHGTIDADPVKVPEKRLGRAAVFGDLVEVLARLLHQRKRLRLEQLHRLDVDVAVGDHEAVTGQCSSQLSHEGLTFVIR